MNGLRYKLGKSKPKLDPRTLHLMRFVPRAGLPTPPARADWTGKVRGSWGMMKNDDLGDCAIAGPGHQIITWTANAGAQFNPSDEQIVKGYEDYGGFDPKDPENSDNGCVILDVLNGWRSGNGIAEHHISGYVSFSAPSYPVTQVDRTHLMQAVSLFEGSIIGLALPAAVQTQLTPSIFGSRTLDIPPNTPLTGDWEPWSLGGHCVDVVAYDSNGVRVVSWGQIWTLTWPFFFAYCDEGFAEVTPDMCNADSRLSASGYDVAGLQAAIAEL
jgi:hypothetical protein